jgi:site-specific recombinase XerD
VAGAERERSLPVQERPAVEPPTTARLAGPAELPREIAADDVASLLAAAPDDVRIAAMLLLAGVRPDEVVVVCGGDVDGAAGTLRIGGASPRTVSLPDPLVRLLAARAVAADTVVVADDHGASLTIGDLDTRLCCAALDAGLADAHAVTAAALWHSYVVFLLRQGVRFVDLVRVVGPLSQASLAAYGSLTPAGPRADLATIERVHPAVGSWAPASSGGPATVS